MATVGRPADAHCCGALGCRRDDDLRALENNDEKRVLCPTHAIYFVGRDG